MLGKAIAGADIPKESYNTTRIYISSGNPTLELNGVALSSSVNNQWDADDTNIGAV